MPTVTVIMPVYNGERHLREAIDSILGQTFRDFEFLIIDDGSTDSTAAILSSYADSRIRVLPNVINRGLAFSLNRGLDEAAGDYLARFDADDIAVADRLEAQVRFLEQNPAVGVVGSWYESFGVGHNQVMRPYSDHAHISANLLFNSAFGHPTVMFRAKTLQTTGARYASDQFPIDDWEMWVRLASLTQLANIPKVLLRYRQHTTSITGTWGAHGGPQSLTVQASRSLYVRMLTCLGIEPSEEDLNVHSKIGFSFPFDNRDERRQAEKWLQRLIAANQITRSFPDPAFTDVIGSRWSMVQFDRVAPLANKFLEWGGSRLVRHSIRAAFRNRFSGHGHEPEA